MTVTVKKIYDHVAANNKPLLMNPALKSAVPAIPDYIGPSFIDYYELYRPYFDRLFAFRYGSRKVMLLENNESFPAIYNDWFFTVDSIILSHIDPWSRLWAALMSDYNPLFNVDVKTTTHTEGTVEGLSGTDKTTENLDTVKTTNNVGNRHSTHNDWDASYDAMTFGEVHPEDPGPDPDLTVVRKTGQMDDASDAATDVSTTDDRENTVKVDYGKSDNVDYTVTEIKQGNQGVTMSQQLLDAEIKTRAFSFFDMLMSVLASEVTYYGGE